MLAILICIYNFLLLTYYLLFDDDDDAIAVVVVVYNKIGVLYIYTIMIYYYIGIRARVFITVTRHRCRRSTTGAGEHRYC